MEAIKYQDRRREDQHFNQSSSSTIESGVACCQEMVRLPWNRKENKKKDPYVK